MAPKFGTSGLRGLVTELTPALVNAHVTGFVRACPTGTGLWVGRDLRDSSPRIAADVITAAQAAGVDVTDCGAVPTPALALGAMQAGAGAIMVTGSHIPADRNGLKFYTPAGELTKAEEAAILRALEQAVPRIQQPMHPGHCTLGDPGPAFVERYLSAFGATALAGQRIGVWSHSAVGRDLLIETLQGLGAEVIEIARATQFTPVDTEAVSPEARALLAAAVAQHKLDAIVSTDGDGDRPLLADAAGQVIAGDILGQMTAQFLGARVVVTPVSSNTGVESLGFARVLRTKIGSPFVIAAMKTASTEKVIGYEANGGFLLGFDAETPAGLLPRLMTRDSHLPIIAPLVASLQTGLAACVTNGPQRFTASDRLQNVPTDRSAALVARLSEDRAALDRFLAGFGPESLRATDVTDGLRLTLSSGRIIHLRPSGNAPELRFYAEAESVSAAQALLHAGLVVLRQHVTPPDPHDPGTGTGA